MATNMTFSQIEQNPLLNALLAPYLSPGAELQRTQASIPGVQAQSAISQQDLVQAQQKAAQVQFMQDARSQLESAKDKNGYVDPTIYNNLQSRASSLNIGQDAFDQTFGSSYTNPAQQINYNTTQGRALKDTQQTIVRQINAQLDQYNKIPDSQRGLISTAQLEDIPLVGQLLAPQAVGYEASKAGLAGQLKGLVGVNRVTQPELNNWLNLLPNTTDSKAVAQKKIQELDSSIKATFNSDTGLDPKYLATNGQNTTQNNTNQSGGTNNTQGASLTPSNGNPPPFGKDIIGALGGILGNKNSQFVEGNLPTIGGILGMTAGAAVPIGGETGATEIAGGGVGQGAGQALQNLLEGRPIGENVPQEVVVGGASGGVGRAIGAPVGAGLNKIGNIEALRGLNLTQSVLNKLGSRGENGESVIDTLKNNNLVGAGVDQLNKKIADTNQVFSDMLSQQNIPVNKEQFLTTALEATNGLYHSSIPAEQALAPKVLKTILNISDKITGGDIKTLADLNTEKTAFDKATANSQFGGANWGLNRRVGAILRDFVQNGVDQAGIQSPEGQTLKQTGLNLRNLINIRDAAEKRIGMGNNPGLYDYLAGLGAFQVGGPLGAIIPYLLRRASENPRVASIVSPAFTNTGQTLMNPMISTGAGVITGGLGNYLYQNQNQ